MAGLNNKRVEEIFTKSKKEKWPYPQIVDALKDAGVEYYETEVATHGIIYHGSGGSISEPPPPGFTPLKPNATFDAAGVKLAIERNRMKADYMVFLQEIARAGVARYRVDMGARTVSYLGAAGQAYVEPVPQFYPPSRQQQSLRIFFAVSPVPSRIRKARRRSSQPAIRLRSGHENCADSKISESPGDRRWRHER